VSRLVEAQILSTKRLTSLTAQDSCSEQQEDLPLNSPIWDSVLENQTRLHKWLFAGHVIAHRSW